MWKWGLRVRLLQHKVAWVSGWGRYLGLWRPLAAIMIVVGLACGCGHIATAVATAAVAPNVVTDDLNDWSKVWSHSPNLTFDTNTANFAGDPSHVSRTQPTAEWIIWKLPSLSAFRALTYFWPSEPVSPFSLLTSPDGLSWTPATPTITAGPQAGWTPYTYTLTPPSGAAYVKMIWNNLSGQVWSPPDRPGRPQHSLSSLMRVSAITRYSYMPVAGGRRAVGVTRPGRT